MVQIKDISTSLAWTFTHLLPGTFKRNKQQFAHLDYPILGPLPTAKTKTNPVESHHGVGPFVYFVVDSSSRLCYIGKSLEACVLKRWIRPGNGGPATHYWTHSIKGGGSVFNIADGLRRGQGPFNLRVTTLDVLRTHLGSECGVDIAMPPEDAIKLLESHLIREMSPVWNH